MRQQNLQTIGKNLRLIGRLTTSNTTSGMLMAFCVFLWYVDLFFSRVPLPLNAGVHGPSDGSRGSCANDVRRGTSRRQPRRCRAVLRNTCDPADPVGGPVCRDPVGQLIRNDNNAKLSNQN